MITCDLCGEAKDCLQKEMDGKEYDICSACWNPLAKKLRGKGRAKTRETVFLPPPRVIQEGEEEEPKPLPGEPLPLPSSGSAVASANAFQNTLTLRLRETQLPAIRGNEFLTRPTAPHQAFSRM